MRHHFNTDATIGTLLIPTLVQGCVAMSFFFIPLISMGVVGLGTREDSGGGGPLQFCADLGRILRDVHHNDLLG